jgi:hypothetical protein
MSKESKMMTNLAMIDLKTIITESKAGIVSIHKWNDWQEPLSDEDYKQIKKNGILFRATIIKASGISRSSLTQNADIRLALGNLEDELRERGVLPEHTNKGGADTSESKSKDLPIGAITAKEAAKLHQRILELESENRALKGDYGRFSEVAAVYCRLGNMN